MSEHCPVYCELHGPHERHIWRPLGRVWALVSRMPLIEPDGALADDPKVIEAPEAAD